jgi:hypothetical protein
LQIHYRYRETVYHIAILQTHAGEDEVCGVTSVVVDGVEQDGQAICLVDDRQEHSVVVTVRVDGTAAVPG